MSIAKFIDVIIQWCLAMLDLFLFVTTIGLYRGRDLESLFGGRWEGVEPNSKWIKKGSGVRIARELTGEE